MDQQRATFLSTLREPRYSTPDRDPAKPIILHGSIGGTEVVFFASPTDAMDYGRELHRRAVKGELGPIGEFVEPPPVQIPKRRK